MLPASIFAIIVALASAASSASAASFPLERRVLSRSFDPSSNGLGSRTPRAVTPSPRQVPKKFWSKGDIEASAIIENKKKKPAPARRSAAVGEIYLDNGWSSSGTCTAEVGGRLLKGSNFNSDKMTYTLCTDFCASRGFTQAGIEYGNECYCSSSVDLKSTQKSTKCNKPCSGDPTKICGGPDSLIIFTTNTAPQKTLSNGWSTTFQCLKDGQNGRAFKGASTSSGAMTQELCTDFCEGKGFNRAGLQYASECYCASDVDLAAAPKSDKCTMSCSGDSNELCGGGNALTVFSAPS